MLLCLSTFSAFAVNSEFDHVYILNSPSTNSSGDDSIVSFDKLGNQSTFVTPDPNLNGMREIAFGTEGDILYALQSHFALGVSRIIYIDKTGAIVDELNMLPIIGLQSMTVNVDGLIYVSNPNNVYQINPKTKSVLVFASYATPHSALDIDHDSNGILYITTGNSNSILKVDTSGNVSIFADSTDGLDSTFGITFDHVANMIWVTNNRGSSKAQIYKFDLNGNGSYYADIGSYIQPQARGILIDSDGLPLVPLGDLDSVVKVDSSGNTADIWIQNIDYPVDLDFAPTLTSVTTITIDIKPSKKPKNIIVLKKNKKLKVAIVGDAIFDALQVDPATIKFGPSGASPIRFKGKDYNHDGFPDLILTFKLNETGISCGDESATLTGETFLDPAVTFQGTDSFTIVGCR